MSGLRKTMLALCLVYLLGSQEALAARNTAQTVGAVRRALEGAAGLRGGAAPAGAAGTAADALGRVERLAERVAEAVHAWAAARREDEQPSEGSLAELHAHMDRTMLRDEAFAAMDRTVLEDAEWLLRSHTEKVDNLNLFLCRRSMITNYTDTSKTGFWVFQERKLGESATFTIRCTSKVNILHHGKVGESVTGEDKDVMVAGIDELKALTQGEGNRGFPIQLKLCTKPDGCQQRSDQQGSYASDESELFGGAGSLTEHIPVTKELIGNLPKAEHNNDHVFAVCYDDQDDCGSVLWVPKNLHTCSGWFKAKHARVLLGRLRDSVAAGAWDRYWTPGGKDRAIKSLGSKVGGEDVDIVRQVDVVTTDGGTCPLREWQEAEDEASEDDLEECLKVLKHAINDKGLYSEEAKDICKDAEMDGEGTDCAEDGGNTACRRLAKKCQRVLGRPMKPYCPSEEDLAMQWQDDANISGDAVNISGDAGNLSGSAGNSSGGSESASLVAVRDGILPTRRHHRARSLFGGFAGRRRRRDSPLLAELVFPPYYYEHQPYCYSWYQPEFGVVAAIPVVPNIGGYTFGLGTFHPGLMLLEGIGHLSYHTAHGLLYMGDAMAGMSSGSSTQDGITSLCHGEACAALLLMALVFIVVIIVGAAVHSHCSKEENCHSWWFRGGRMRRKQERWSLLWEGIEEDVYARKNGSLIFDVHAPGSKHSCMKELQWGRRWVTKSDGRWKTGKPEN